MADVNTQDEVNDLLCSISRSSDSNIPSDSAYSWNNDTPAQDTAWGLAKTGVMIYNGISGEGVDPFYPSRYGGADPIAAVERTDWCLAHPQFDGYFHYHAASTCIADPSL
jgi:hypothetical protein